MNQYIKKNPIKWAFKFWYCFESHIEYFYQFNIY